jgi:16S rRNA (guanine966-N2)-methyltransferase
MRILSGQFRGKYLSAGQDLSIRPITNKNKEIIFSILGDFYKDRWILDLFSGSGSIGLEAISRGAKGVTFVEKETTSIQILKLNIDALSIEPDKIEIMQADVLDYIRRGEKTFQLVLADPPFRYPEMQSLVEEICEYKILDTQGVLMLHHEIDNQIQLETIKYYVLKQKKVGRSLLSFIVQGKENV